MCLRPLPPDVPLVTALALAVPDRICDVWLESGRAGPPFPVRIASTGGWRTLVLGADLGALLDVVELAVVNAGSGPVLLGAPELRARRAIDLDDGVHVRCIALDGRPPEEILAVSRPVSRSQIRYLG
ncbi:MAG TPA: hypothetical protein VFI41_08350 [Gemmatimonadales bacterium]|nr:hypothetical protein [Gemmatimonadales bacterium]